MGKPWLPSAKDYTIQIESLGDTQSLALRAPGREYPQVTIYRWQGAWNLFFWSSDRRLVFRRRDYDPSRVVQSVQEFVGDVTLEEAEVRFPER